MNGIFIRLSSGDTDIIKYLEEQPNKTKAIKEALRFQIAREDMINEMLNALADAGGGDAKIS